MKLFKIRLPFKNIVRLSDHFLAHRDIGILKIGDNFGEVSPLPFFNTETFEDVQKSLGDPSKFPSLNWAFYNANNISDSFMDRTLQLSGLILESENKYLYKAIEYEKLCYGVIKLKVGSDLKLDREKILNICNATENMRLRLDFNSRGTIHGLELFLNELPLHRIEYLEDPLHQTNFEKLENLFFKTKIPYAIDYQNQVIPKNLRGLKTFIVKPMRVRVEKIKELQRDYPHTQIILSSSFESNLGLFQIAKLAYDLGLENLSHGVDTQDYFKENLFQIQKKLNRLILPPDHEVTQHITKITNSMVPIQ